MATDIDALRAQLARLLDWKEAHAGFDKAVDGLPADKRGLHANGFDHSPWELLEHLRIAQADILDFCVSATYLHDRTWPDDYWPRSPAPPDPNAWDESVTAFKADREALKDLAKKQPNLFALVPTGKEGHTYLRAILLAADHCSYHVGQLVAVRRALGAWS